MFLDPNGLYITNSNRSTHQEDSFATLGNGNSTIAQEGCVLTTYVRIAQTLGANVTLEQANDFAKNNNLYSGKQKNLLTPDAGVSLVNGLLRQQGINNIELVKEESLEGKTNTEFAVALNKKQNEGKYYFVTGRISTNNKDGTEEYEHTVNIDSGTFSTENFSDFDNILGFTYNDTALTNRKNTSDKSRKNKVERLDFFSVSFTGAPPSLPSSISPQQESNRSKEVTKQKGERHGKKEK